VSSVNFQNGALKFAGSSQSFSPTMPERAARVAHIDGLRAIAVLAVVGYHSGVPGFSGG
jgi:peptidoglycan/LPS O-acetylase OafA/YrhL